MVLTATTSVRSSFSHLFENGATIYARFYELTAQINFRVLYFTFSVFTTKSSIILGSNDFLLAIYSYVHVKYFKTSPAHTLECVFLAIWYVIFMLFVKIPLQYSVWLFKAIFYAMRKRMERFSWLQIFTKNAFSKSTSKNNENRKREIFLF